MMKITTLIRMFLALTSHAQPDARQLESQDRIAHEVCEAAIEAVAPTEMSADDRVTLRESLCDNDPAPQLTAPGCVCTYDESYDCDGADGDECYPWDCTGDNDACDRLMETNLPGDEFLARCVYEHTGPDGGISLADALHDCHDNAADASASDALAVCVYERTHGSNDVQLADALRSCRDNVINAIDGTADASSCAAW
jgi:hypothetical protein